MIDALVIAATEAAGAGRVVVEPVRNELPWEAALIAAIPATLALIGTIVTALLGRRNKQHLQAIDEAVNNVHPGEASLKDTSRAAGIAARAAAQAAVDARNAARALANHQGVAVPPPSPALAPPPPVNPAPDEAA